MADKVIGITGGIASGKTTVSDELARLGAKIIDADLISREVNELEECKTALRAAFPSAFDGDRLNRVKLREIAFSTPEDTKKLNSITHPLIIRELKNRINATDGIVFLVVPLMFETGCEKLCDEVITVSAEEKTRIKRLMARNTDITEELAKAIVSRQAGEEDRLARADRVIRNDGDLAEVKREVKKVYEYYCGGETR